MKIAVEGCCHGELDRIYSSVEALEKKEGIKIDLLIICGDFQAIRNPQDLECMAVSQKYRTLNTFYKYYSGEMVAPILTIFIGGNHESSAFMQELPYGGWVAHNIFYMGYSNLIQVGGLRVAGISGIFKGRDYCRGHHERPPYDQDSVRSCYHWRDVDVFKMRQVAGHVDIMLTHDWPRGIYHFGDVEGLLRHKTYFRKEVEENSLGNPIGMELLKEMKPSYWFSAHLHCKFSALIGHLDGKQTKFLALDKCLPRRKFLQVIDIPTPNYGAPFKINLDPDWLAILKSTNDFMRVSKDIKRLDQKKRVIKDIEEVRRTFNGEYSYPCSFTPTAPIYLTNNNNNNRKNNNNKININKNNNENDLLYINDQTEWWCGKLGLKNPFKVFKESGYDNDLCNVTVDNPDEIKLDEEDDYDDDGDDSSCVVKCVNPDEINLDDDDEEEDGDDVKEGDGNDDGESTVGGEKKLLPPMTSKLK